MFELREHFERLWSRCLSLRGHRVVPHQSRCFEHTMQRTTASSVLRAGLRCRPLNQRRRVGLKADGYPRDFIFLPNFYSPSEQRILLSAALQRLDSLETRQYRRRRKEHLSQSLQTDSKSTSIQDVFLPDEFYCFEDVRLFYGCHILTVPHFSLTGPL